MNKAKHAADPEETPDIVPDHPLTGKEAEEDYRKQLALLEEQNKERIEKIRKAPLPGTDDGASQCMREKTQGKDGNSP
ncbi:hypothetical protein LZL87_010811 [Fusarium oxysporum]|nr:hypothetical protein LZL87_010811 [Fusarium oxysporum]